MSDDGEWTPDPDEDDRDDPNPRAMPARTPVEAARAMVASTRPRKAGGARVGDSIRELIDQVGMKGVLEGLLEQAEMQADSKVEGKCPKCDHVTAPFYKNCPKCEGDRNRRIVDRVAELVRDIKEIAIGGDPDPNRERQIMHELREYDHPDIDGLLRWCTAARDRGGKSPPKRSTKW